MTGLMPFLYGDVQVRTVINEGQAWFVAADVCTVLGLSNPSMAVSGVDADDLSSAEVIDSMGRKQTARTVSESGLYELVFQSRRPEAKGFRRWVTREVLPIIRQTGSYNGSQGRELSRLELIDMARDSEVGRLAAEERVQELEPSALAWDHLASTAAGDLSVNEAAKTLSRDPAINIGETRLWKLLDEWRWTYRDHSGDRRPYQTHVDNGRLACRARSHHHPRTGELLIDAPQVRVTPKGLADIRRRLVRSELRSVS